MYIYIWYIYIILYCTYVERCSFGRLCVVLHCMHLNSLARCFFSGVSWRCGFYRVFPSFLIFLYTFSWDFQCLKWPKNVSYSRGSFNYPILGGFERMQTDGHLYNDLPEEKKVHDVWVGHIMTPVWKLRFPRRLEAQLACLECRSQQLHFLLVGSSEPPWVSQKTRGAQVLEFRFHRTYLPSLAGGKVLRSSI